MKKIEINHLLIFLVISSGLFFLFLVGRNIGLYPIVFADEYIYSKFSRLLPLSESSIPGYLYLKLYSFTNYCGDGFLSCVKIINSVLFVAAAPFIYLIARRVTSPAKSVFISLISIFGPINSYTAYFMPESFYFLSFWVFCWYLLSLSVDSHKWRWTLAGVIFAISALIKPHSLFFLPAVLIYIAFIFFCVRRPFTKSASLALLLFLLGALSAKFGLGLILAGSKGLTFLGPMYGSIAESTASNPKKYIQLLLLSLEVLKGHALVLSLIYGLPLMLAIAATGKMLLEKNNQPNQGKSREFQYGAISFLSLAIIINLIFVAVFFTASVANSGPYETPYRLHMRYYNFALPLFYLIAIGALTVIPNAPKWVRYVLGGTFGILSLYAIWTNLAPYTPAFVSSPEIRGLHADRFYFQFIGGLLVFSTVLWIYVQSKGVQFYLYIALPLFVAVSTYHIGLDLKMRQSQDVYDKAGIFTKQYLNSRDLSKVLIVGSDTAGLYRALFYLDDSKSSLEVIQRGANYDLAKLPNDKEWVLIIGDHEITGAPFYQIPMNGFVLAGLVKENTLDFKKAAWPGIIRKAQGLSMPEIWGTWSQSDLVLFEFMNPLPKKFEIHLTAHAFGPNINGTFEVTAGGVVARFKLSANDQVRVIQMENAAGSNSLLFKVPHVASPKDLGLGADERKLGIGFVEMKIIQLK